MSVYHSTLVAKWGLWETEKALKGAQLQTRIFFYTAESDLRIAMTACMVGTYNNNCYSLIIRCKI